MMDYTSRRDALKCPGLGAGAHRFDKAGTCKYVCSAIRR